MEGVRGQARVRRSYAGRDVLTIGECRFCGYAAWGGGWFWYALLFYAMRTAVQLLACTNESTARLLFAVRLADLCTSLFLTPMLLRALAGASPLYARPGPTQDVLWSQHREEQLGSRVAAVCGALNTVAAATASPQRQSRR